MLHAEVGPDTVPVCGMGKYGRLAHMCHKAPAGTFVVDGHMADYCPPVTASRLEGSSHAFADRVPLGSWRFRLASRNVTCAPLAPTLTARVALSARLAPEAPIPAREACSAVYTNLVLSMPVAGTLVAGSYADTAGSTVCRPCAADTEALMTGAYQCTACSGA